MSESTKPHSGKPLTFFIIAMINVATVLSIRNWPLAAEYGFSSLFFIILSALGFFIPVSLVSAELGSTYSKSGGVYAWVKEALGHRMGFLAIWLQWSSNLFYYPIIISFIAATFAFTFNPALAFNNVYTFFVIFILYWSATFLDLKGIRMSGLVSTASVIAGTFLPGCLIIILGIIWFIAGRPLEITMSWDSFVPNLNNIYQLSLLAGMILGFAGMEMPSVHVKDLENPRKNYPKAILLSASIIVILSILGVLSIAMVIPQDKISLLSGSMDAIGYFLGTYQLNWLIPLVSLLITFGAFGTVSTWIIGPSRGLLRAAQDGDLPAFLHKTNKQGMPISMLIVQGIIVTILSCLFLFIPDVSSSFWILTALSSILYCAMYLIMFISAIILRFKEPHIERPYRIPGPKNIGMILVAGIGALVALFVIVLGFYPPLQLVLGKLDFYERFLSIGFIAFIVSPFIILLFRKPKWAELKDTSDKD